MPGVTAGAATPPLPLPCLLQGTPHSQLSVPVLVDPEAFSCSLAGFLIKQWAESVNAFMPSMSGPPPTSWKNWYVTTWAPSPLGRVTVRGHFHAGFQVSAMGLSSNWLPAGLSHHYQLCLSLFHLPPEHTNVFFHLSNKLILVSEPPRSPMTSY